MPTETGDQAGKTIRSKTKQQKLTTYPREVLAASAHGRSGSYHAKLQEGRSGQSFVQVHS